MSGMDKYTGKRIDGIDHIRQSLMDVLTTPVGSRVMLREYGSLLPELIGQPLNDATLLQAYSAIVMAQIRWERRIRIERIVKLVNADQPGTAHLVVEAVRLDTSTPDAALIDLEMPFGRA
ncbi:MAG: GPW/gp25 family protein [Ectothiorhodospiraceae bacterium]|nr:GPW/gp25 family protein [Ectothiorhodospiraceae bacterium]